MRVLITGGPTRAYLDAIRYLSNRSTGGLAFELCRAFSQKKNRVTAVIGPTNLPFETLPIRYRSVETNEEMLKAVLEICHREKPNLAIFSAAVLDFVPSTQKNGKVSSQQSQWNVRLKPFPKIIDLVGKKFPNIRRIGFKLESKRRSGRARDRWAEEILRKKGLELLVVNFLPDVSKKTHVAYLYRNGAKPRKLLSKRSIARAINVSSTRPTQR